MRSQASSLPSLRNESVRYERDASGTIMRITDDGIRTHINFIYADGQPVVIQPYGTGVTKRFERDANGVLLEITEDGVRTHTKFIYEEDIAGPSQPLNAQDGNAEVAPAPSADGHDSVMSNEGEDDDDDARSATPTARSSSTRTSGIMGVNHWVRRAPVMPNAFEGAPGSDQATEVVANDHTRFSLPPPSIRALSRASGSTQRPMSEGHANAGSAFLPYQEVQISEYECVNPGLALRAKAMRLVQACDAAQRNLSVATVNYEVASDVCSSDADPRYSSPCPSSARVYAASMASREVTPMPLPLGEDEESEGPVFDLASWRWRVDLELKVEDDAQEGCVPESSSLTEGSEETVKPCRRIPYVSGLTSRDPSPLTVYSYKTDSKPRATGKVLRLPATPGSSSSRGRGRDERIVTRKRSRKLRR